MEKEEKKTLCQKIKDFLQDNEYYIYGVAVGVAVSIVWYAFGEAAGEHSTLKEWNAFDPESCKQYLQKNADDLVEKAIKELSE